MASPRNRHCASCIGTLSFPINKAIVDIRRRSGPEFPPGGQV